MRERVLDPEARKVEILVALKDDPGLSYRSLARVVGMSAAGAHKLVRQLEAEGRITEERCSKCGQSMWRVRGRR